MKNSIAQTLCIEKKCMNFILWYVTNYNTKKSTIVNELLKRGIQEYIAEKALPYVPTSTETPHMNDTEPVFEPEDNGTESSETKLE